MSAYDELPKKIFMYWDQGWDKAPRLVQACLSSWKTHNPEFEVIALDASDISSELSIYRNSFYGWRSCFLAKKWKIPIQALSDIFRLELLHQYGGLWVDATVLCRQPLKDWLPGYFVNGFFAFNNPINDGVVASWFLASLSDNQLMTAWYNSAKCYWDGRRTADRYAWVHYLFVQLLEQSNDLREEFSEIPVFDANSERSIGPHRFVPYYEKLNILVDDVVLKDLETDSIPLYKLTWRHKIEKGTVGEYLLGGVHSI